MRFSPRFFLCSSGALLGLGIVLVALEYNDTQELRGRIFAVRQNAASLAAVNGQQTTPVEPASGPHKQLDELLSWRDRMRSRVEQLREQLAVSPGKGIPPKPQPRPADAGRDTWNNLGRNTPAEAFETVLCSIERSDVDALANLIGFDAEARTEAQRLYAVLPEDLRSQYDSPQSLVAALMAVNTPIPFDEMNVIKETVPDSDNGVLHLSVALSRPSRQPQQVTLRFQRDAAGWRLLVPALIIDGYRHRVMGTTSLAEPDPR